MTLTFRRARYAALTVFLGATLVWGGRAEAQDQDTLQRIVKLNKKALAAYDGLDMEEAARLLKQALELCAAEGLEKHQAAARTHIHLGVVYVSGLKQRDQALAEFKAALSIEPTIKVTKTLINPDVQAAFEEASIDASAGGAKAPPTPEPEPTPPPPEPPPAAPVNMDAISHPPITEGTPGRHIMVKAQVPRSLGVHKLVLAYRSDGAGSFLAREMVEIGRTGWYQAKIPGDATRGRSVAYYIEAQSPDGQVLALNGTSEDPHLVVLGGEEVAGGGAGGDAGAVAASAAEGEAGGLSLWMAVTVGGGYGYHSGKPEANASDDAGKELKVSGTGMASLLQISPEIGYFHSDRLILSLQGRLQIVTGASEVKGSQVLNNPKACGGATCKPSKFAPALLAKAMWLPVEPAAFTPFVTFSAGAGEIRQLVTVNNVSGCTSKNTCTDTVRGGLALAGAGAGFTYELTDTMLFIANVNALVGVPDFLANLDVNVGLAFVK